MSIDQRLSALRERMAADSLDAVMVTMASNVDYITGATELHDEENPHVAFVTAHAAVLYTDSRYDEAAAEATASTEWSVVRPDNPATTHIAAAVRSALAHDATVGIEGAMSHAAFTRWSEALAPLQVRALDQMVERIREVKDDDEIARIAAAQALADAAFTSLLGTICAGMTEREVALELDFAMRRAGADGEAFPTIVASGPNGSRPHAVPGDRRLQAGDLVTIDFGALKDGYRSDTTRTIAIGEPSAAHRAIYDTVLAANRAGVAALADGVEAVAVDRAAREVIERAGWGALFGHGTGHGVGIDIHEGPGVSPRSEGSLRAGMVVTVEPGVYLPGETGARIEDLVVVTADGARVLSTLSRDLIVVDR